MHARVCVISSAPRKTPDGSGTPIEPTVRPGRTLEHDSRQGCKTHAAAHRVPSPLTPVTNGSSLSFGSHRHPTPIRPIPPAPTVGVS